MLARHYDPKERLRVSVRREAPQPYAGRMMVKSNLLRKKTHTRHEPDSLPRQNMQPGTDVRRAAVGASGGNSPTSETAGRSAPAVTYGGGGPPGGPNGW